MTDTGCPTCESSGVTPEQMERDAPRYMAALRSLTEAQCYPIPDEPSACCWGCRRMIAAGMDPAAIIAPDHAEFRARKAVT